MGFFFTFMFSVVVLPVDQNKVRHEPHLPLPLISSPTTLPCLQMKIQKMQSP